MNHTIFVTAELKMNADKPREFVIQAIEQFCVDMQGEAGCIQAIATYDETDLQRVILWEQYEDYAAVSAHLTMRHTQAFIAAGMVELIQAFETKTQHEVKS